MQLKTSTTLRIHKIAVQFNIEPTILERIKKSECSASKGIIVKRSSVFKQEEKDLFNIFLSNKIAHKIIYENTNILNLRITEQKAKYLK